MSPPNHRVVAHFRRGQHLCLLCPFSQAVCNQVSTWENFPLSRNNLPDNYDSICELWEAMVMRVPKDQRRAFNEMAFYIMWILWKERNRGILDNVHSTAMQVAERTRECIEQFKHAFSSIPG
ncbi:hypothetical protein SETIT_5G138000v2 [Setaria italica]|uniref:Uncharacterized protein n=1 Tax=Setaria italica TaxID=4555 RepID=A0A368R4K6_SETIT|nr:hypothetical protein SETIT_5G138000v2 [Setaria italica]